MITKEIAMKLRSNDTLHHRTLKNRDGTPLRSRTNGRCKTWKTRPQDFELPMTTGFRTHFYLTPRNADKWEVTK